MSSSQPERPVRLLICDDQAIVCEGLRAIVAPVARIEVVGVASDGLDALAQAREAHPDVVLMDLKMPRMNGIQATRAIREELPETRVLVLTTYDTDEWVIDAIRNGASGYLLKDTPQEDLVQAILETADGLSHIDPHVAGKLMEMVSRQPGPPYPDQKLVSQLSEREREVLRLVANGLSNTEIAEALFLSDGTVKNYVSTLLSKLGVADRTQAAILAIRLGLADLNKPPAE